MRLRHTASSCGRSTAVSSCGRSAAAVLAALLAPLAALSCSDPGRGDSGLLDELERMWAPTSAEPAEAAVDPTPPGCRTVAVQRNVRVGATSGASSCQFEPGSAVFSCRTALGHSGEATSSEFASLSDFIEAGRLRGKVTSLREVRTLGKRQSVTQHEYDDLGRLLTRHELRPEGDVVYRFADYDDLGRPRSAQPTRATLEQWACAAAPMTIEYGEARVRYQYRPPASCNLSEYSVVERFDVTGNLVRIERFSPAGVETLFEADAAAATQLLCG
jgi:hypothetical protein